MKREFTLVELLIVIAIIGVLVTLLLPSLTKAKEHAKLAICMSQQAQLARMVMSYTKQNSGRMLPHRSDYTIARGHETRYFYRRATFSSRANFGHLYPDEESIGNAKVFYCPSQTSPLFSYSTYAPFPRPATTDSKWGNKVRISYNYNPERKDGSKIAAYQFVSTLESDALLLTDIFTQALMFEKRGESVLGHHLINAISVTRGDGSVKTIRSKNLLNIIRTRDSDSRAEMLSTVEIIKERF